MSVKLRLMMGVNEDARRGEMLKCLSNGEREKKQSRARRAKEPRGAKKLELLRVAIRHLVVWSKETGSHHAVRYGC